MAGEETAESVDHDAFTFRRFAQRALAAFRAALVRSDALMFLARALPPALPIALK